MLIPMDRPMIDARNIKDAATQTISGDGYTLQHNNRPAVLLTITGPGLIRTSSATTAIADGMTTGQLLKIIVVDEGNYNGVLIKDNANTKLSSDWKSGWRYGTLLLVWDGSDWLELDRDSAGCANSLVGQGTRNLGGAANTASENYSAVLSGQNNTVSAQKAATLAGVANTASAEGAVAEGEHNTASGWASHVMGQYASADQKFEFAQGGDRFAAGSLAQYRRFVCRKEITHSDANWYTIGIDSSSVGPVISEDSAWTFRAEVIGATQDCGKVFSYLVNGCIERIGNTTTLHAHNVTVIHEDDADFDCQAVADDTNEALSIQVQDATSGSDVVRWVVTIHVTEVRYT